MEEEPMEVNASSSKGDSTSNEENSCDTVNSSTDVGDRQATKEAPKNDDDVTSVENEVERTVESADKDAASEVQTTSATEELKETSKSNSDLTGLAKSAEPTCTDVADADPEDQTTGVASAPPETSKAQPNSTELAKPAESTNVVDVDPEGETPVAEDDIQEMVKSPSDSTEPTKTAPSAPSTSAVDEDPEGSADVVLESIEVEAETVVKEQDNEDKERDKEEDSSDDDGVQEIHDVEAEVGEVPEGSMTRDDSAPEQVAPLPYEVQIRNLASKVTSLQSELEETRQKLTRAEKKLNKSRRHKESAESYNYDLRRKVKHLKKEVHRFRKAAKKTYAEVGCQTMPSTSSSSAAAGVGGGVEAEGDPDDVVEIASTSGLGIGSRGLGGWTMEDDHHHPGSLADSLRATAEAAMSNSGFVLDPNSGLYYDYSTGYYYDPNNHLYYDPATGVYYYYDQGSRTYQFHSQVSSDPTGMLPMGDRPRRGKRRKDRRQRESTPDYNDLQTAMSNLSITSGLDLSTTSGSPSSSPSQVVYQAQPSRYHQPAGMLKKLLREFGSDENMECEVIEVPDDDSPENKRPRKTQRKSKKGSPSKAPHTATSEDPTNMETDNQESTAKENDEEEPSKSKDGDKSKSPRKEKGTPKKGSKRRKKSRSTEQKKAENSENKSQEKNNETEKMTEASKEKTKDKESTSGPDDGNEGSKDTACKESGGDKLADSEQDKGKEKEVPEEGECADENDNETEKQSPDAGEASKQTTGSPPGGRDEDNDGRDKDKDKTTEAGTSTSGTSSDKTGPPAPEKTSEGSPGEAPPDEQKEDDEIMELENKKKEDIEEITILDSDEDDSEMEEGELSDSSGDLSSSDDSSEYESDGIAEVTPVRQEFPPCIRMIVTRSEKIQLGSLFIVTCTGGTIGREGNNHVVTIPELGVSKQHAEIKYNETSKQYTIRDLGSQNGTLINGKMLSKARSVSEPHPVTHKDYLTVGATTLRVHIHQGSDTCDECEPGQAQALIAQLNPENNQVTYAIVTPADKEQMRRKELRKMKKKYNLVRDKYVQQQDPSTSNSCYKDRAGTRRKTVGSDNPHQKDDAPASVDKAIGDTNVGRKMLEKMGWKEGEGLGKADQGIKEPIQVLVHNKNAGLGAGVGVSMDQAQYVTQGRNKNQRWQKAKARFDKIRQQEGAGLEEARKAATSNGQTQWVKGGTETLEDANAPADTGNEADAQEDCIEILSPSSDDNNPSAPEVGPSLTSSTSTVPSDAVASVSSTTSPAAGSAPKPIVNTRPKIQLKLQPKKVKEQLPSTSVILDDGDEEEEEEVDPMEATASSDKNSQSESACNNRTTRTSGKSSTKENESKSKTVDADNGTKAGSESQETTEPMETELENNVSTSKEETSKTAESSARGKSGKSPRKNKWVKIGGDGDKNKSDDKQDNEEKDVENNSQEKDGEMTGTGEAASSTSAIENMQNDSQTDSTKGRRRRTRRTKKNEDMFADLRD